MLSVDGKVYIDIWGKKYIKMRDIGYELFAYLNDDDTFSYMGGCVGEEFGLKVVKHETIRDKAFKAKIEKAKLKGFEDLEE